MIVKHINGWFNLVEMKRMQAQLDLDHARTDLEKVMLEMDPNAPEEHHRQYLGGHIDAMARYGIIDEQTRDTLYTEYGP